MRAENAHDFLAKSARIPANFGRVSQRTARAWLAQAAQRHLRCYILRRNMHALFDCVSHAFGVRSAPIWSQNFGYRANLHQVSRRIGAPCTPNDCKTCARSMDGPYRLLASILVIVLMVRWVARRKCARFFSENRADVGEFLQNFRAQRARVARKICAKAS